MNSVKSVTIMMIDGICFPAVHLSMLGMGGVHGEGHQFDGSDEKLPFSQSAQIIKQNGDSPATIQL